MARGCLLCILLGVASAVAAGAAEPLPSGQIDHPAVLHMVTDRRLVVDPARTAELVRQAMALTDEQVRELILPLHGLTEKLVCPTCGCQKLNFSLERPEQIDCPECGAVLTADTLPLDMELTGPNRLGETVTYPCHNHPRGPVCIAGTIRYRRHQELADAARALGETYHQGRDEALARRAVLIMARFAEVYPHWPVFERWGKSSTYQSWHIGPPPPYNHWLFGRWDGLFMYEIPQSLVFAYDLTYQSPAWEELSAELGRDVRARVETELFRSALDFAVGAHADCAGHLTNLDPTLHERMIHLGRVLNDPDVIHQAVRFMQDMIRVYYQFDGMEYEGTLTYHGVVTGRLGIAVRMLSGYADPEGYVDERFGIVLGGGENPLDFPIYTRAWQIGEIMTFPNGNRMCVHDTSWGEGRAETPPDAVPANIELSAYGHFAIGGGLGRDGMQAHLHFCPRILGGHFHEDRLALTLWGAGEELLPDTGYVSMGKPHRYFINDVLGHNTVQVLFDDPPRQPEIVQPATLPTEPVERFRAAAMAEWPVLGARSHLLAYDPGTVSEGRVKLMAAASPGPEWMGMKRQERHLLMCRVDARRCYLVDVFRLEGGDGHRFILRASADEDVSTNCGLPLQPVPGTLAGPDIPYGQVTKGVYRYSWLVHDLRRAKVTEPWELTWTGAESGASVRAFFAQQDDATVTLGMSPTLRRGMQDARRADGYQGPHLLVDHPGPESAFAVVYDCWPKGGEPAVQSVRWERLGEGAEAPLVLRVALDGREDIIYCSLDNEERRIGGVGFSGQWGVLSQRDGRPEWAWTHDGRVSAEGIEVHSSTRMELPLLEVQRTADGAPANALVVVGAIPDGETLVGQWVRVHLGDDPVYGYGVESVRAEGDRTVIGISGEPGMAVTGDRWQLLFNPFYQGEGPCRVEIARSAFITP